MWSLVKTVISETAIVVVLFLLLLLAFCTILAVPWLVR